MNYQQELNKAYTALDNMKKLIEDRKNLPLTVGTWYNIKLTGYTDAVICYQGENSYGWGHRGVWTDCYQIPFGSRQVESDLNEVEESLVKEAIKRGYKVGETICRKKIDDSLPTLKIDKETFPSDKGFHFYQRHFETGKPFIEYNGFVVFYDGQWADIVEEVYDKFAELKEAHRNGAVIQYKHKGLPNWIDNPNPAWSDNYDYRVKPAYVPHPGDICKFWDDDENFFIISKLSHYTGDTYGYVVQIDMDFLHYKNAKVVLEKEVIELLFKSK